MLLKGSFFSETGYVQSDRGCAENRPQCSAGTWRATGQSSRRHLQEHKAVQMSNGVRPLFGCYRNGTSYESGH